MSKNNLCCIFNYAPLYRESIYKKIDEVFNVQFYFGKEVIEGKKSGIKKLDYSIFKKKPIEFRNVLLFGKILWRTGITFLPLKKEYSSFIITGDLCLTYVFFLFFCKLCGKKVYAWGHGVKSMNGKLFLLTKWIYANIDKYFTYGEKGKQRLIELGFPDNKFEVIYNSLNKGINGKDLMKFKSDVYFRHFGNNYPVLIFVGRLTPVKKLDWLVRIIAEERKEGVYYNLVFIGDGTERKQLELLSANLNVINSVWFYGECYEGDELNLLLYNADVCVSPGNVGLTAIHAMEYGTPVITHDNFEKQMPEYESIVKGKTGNLYEYGNFEDLKLKIREWIEGVQNRDVVREKCFKMINSHYNSDYQIRVLKKTIDAIGSKSKSFNEV